MITGIATWLATKIWGGWLLKLVGLAGKAIHWVFSSWKHAVIFALAVTTVYYYIDRNQERSGRDRALATVVARNKTIDARNKTIDARDKTIDDMTAASEAARIAQIALNKAQQDRYVANKDKADENHRKALGDAHSRLNRYIAANRMRTAKGDSAISQADPATESADTGLPEAMPRNAVMVDEAELRRVTALAQIGISAIDWAQGLIADGVAE